MKLFGILLALVMLISAFGFVELASLGVRCPDDSSTTGERCIPSDGWDPQHSAHTIFDEQASEKCETFKINKYQ
ncbi:unnamed protein product [Arctia plantaginis]|uniref:Uncharacterized protein n=1 Tax=Arctia plantaginis TaxID=874455 RepID=A0A8S0Z3H8_ARCPL|nr:unnamed protein product [Arctia plantaginis]